MRLQALMEGDVDHTEAGTREHQEDMIFRNAL
jgi:hypothetical protein